MTTAFFFFSPPATFGLADTGDCSATFKCSLADLACTLLSKPNPPAPAKCNFDQKDLNRIDGTCKNGRVSAIEAKEGDGHQGHTSCFSSSVTSSAAPRTTARSLPILTALCHATNALASAHHSRWTRAWQRF